MIEKKIKKKEMILVSRGKRIYFTAEEIRTMKHFDHNFDTYFLETENKELYERLLKHGMWLILDKFSRCVKADKTLTTGKSIYFSYQEINFMSSFICEIDRCFPAASDQDRKEQLINIAGKALLKFVWCFNKYYRDDNQYPLKKYCKYESRIVWES